jgi:hypothetical protein
MELYWLVLGVLCVWRLTHLLNAEDGPGDLLVRFRRRLGSGFWGGLMDCFYCLSLWVAAPLALLLGREWKERLLLWPALSGAAILLERATARPEVLDPAAVHYQEEEENGDVLQQGTTTTDGNVSGDWQRQSAPDSSSH